MLIQLLKTGIQVSSIRKVSGIGISHFIKITFGDKMSIEIEMKALTAMAKSLCKDNAAEEVLLRIREAGYIRLDELVRELILHGADRRALLSALRKEGVADYDLADAFSAAISDISEMNGKKKTRVISD